MPDRPSGPARGPNVGPRPGPVDREPSSRVGLALVLLDEMTRTADRLRPVLQAIEEVTGLRPEQVKTLLTIASRSPSSTPDETGGGVTGSATDRSTAPADTDLIARGLLEPAPDDDGPVGGTLRLTDRGLAVLSQVQGVRIRILDTLVSALGDRRVGDLLDSLHAVGAVLDDLPVQPGARG